MSDEIEKDLKKAGIDSTKADTWELRKELLKDLGKRSNDEIQERLDYCKEHKQDK